MTIKMQWHGDQVIGKVRNIMAGRLAVAGESLGNQIRTNIEIQGPPASLPGEFPHQDTGLLHESILTSTNKREMVSRIRAATDYAIYVEASRPYMRRTLREMKATLRSILLKGN